MSRRVLFRPIKILCNSMSVPPKKSQIIEKVAENMANEIDSQILAFLAKGGDLDNFKLTLKEPHTK